MQAAVVEQPGQLAVRQVSPPTPGDYEALCQISHCATCAGTDWDIISGTFFIPVTYPTLLGHESVGRVVAVGPKVRHLRVGDQVTKIGAPPAPDAGLDSHWGGFAEYGIAVDHRAQQEDGLPRDLWWWRRSHQVLPTNMDPVIATLVPMLRETLSYLTRLGVSRGSRVIVLGSGGGGLAFTAHARIEGAAEVVVLGNAARRDLALRAGATRYYDYRAEDWLDRMRQETAEPFDCIVDSVGCCAHINRLLERVRPEATLGVYGLNDFGHGGIDPHRAPGAVRLYNGGYDEAEVHDQVVARLVSGALDPTIWIDPQAVRPLAEINTAFADLQARRAVKIVLHTSG